MTNEKPKQASRNLNAYLQFLPPKKRDTIYGLASTLCAEHASIAFIAGLQLGAQLMLDLQQNDEIRFAFVADKNLFGEAASSDRSGGCWHRLLTKENT